RIEGGILAWGSDIGLDTNPFEVGYGYEVSWMVDLAQEADFIGKAALTRIRDEGVRRKLVGVEIGGSRLGSYNDGSMIDAFPVYAPGGDAPIGKVTSACHSPRLDRNIGFAMVPIGSAELGTELLVGRPGETVPAVVVEKPFVDPQKMLPKQDLRASAARGRGGRRGPGGRPARSARARPVTRRTGAERAGRSGARGSLDSAERAADAVA